MPDVPDETTICVALTPIQAMAYPMVAQPMCRETIGGLRARYLQEQQVVLRVSR
jgi:hypothetical protein